VRGVVGARDLAVGPYPPYIHLMSLVINFPRLLPFFAALRLLCIITNEAEERKAG